MEEYLKNIIYKKDLQKKFINQVNKNLDKNFKDAEELIHKYLNASLKCIIDSNNNEKCFFVKPNSNDTICLRIQNTISNESVKYKVILEVISIRSYMDNYIKILSEKDYNTSLEESHKDHMENIELSILFALKMLLFKLVNIYEK